MSQKLRILCLHGFTSNGAVHAHQLRRLTTLLPEYDFLFPDGPHSVDIATQMDMSSPANQAWSELVTGLSPTSAGHRAWWFAREEGYEGLESSLRYLGEYLSSQQGGGGGGGVHAIWGFSQGACLAGILCALLQGKLHDHPLRRCLGGDGAEFATPACGVIFSGFRARFARYDGLYDAGIEVPVLHVLGERDPLVQSERSEALIRCCKGSVVLKHGGGHDIPKGEEDQRRIVEFVRSCGTRGRSATASI